MMGDDGDDDVVPRLDCGWNSDSFLAASDLVGGAILHHNRRAELDKSRS